MYTLALALGWPVGVLEAHMTSAEFEKWRTFNATVEPITAKRWDHQLAMIAATIANTTRKKGQAPFRPKQFLPQWAKVKQTAAQMMAVAIGAAKKHGARDLRNGSD